MVFETEETASFEIENAETCVISGIEPIEIGEEQSEAHKFGANAHVDVFDDDVYKGDENLPFVVYACSQVEAMERVRNYLLNRNEELAREGEGVEVEIRNVSVWKCVSECQGQ